MIARQVGQHPTTNIVFAGRIAGVGADGGHEVRLDNGHHVQAYDATGATAPRPGLGARVSVEMAPNEMRGWRLRAPAPSPQTQPLHSAAVWRRISPERAS